MVRSWLDDLDGSPAVENVTFSFRGTTYEVDVSELNLKRLETALEDYMIAGREVPASDVSAAIAETHAFVAAQRAAERPVPAPVPPAVPAPPVAAIEAPARPADLGAKDEAYIRLEFDDGEDTGEDEDEDGAEAQDGKQDEEEEDKPREAEAVIPQPQAVPEPAPPVAPSSPVATVKPSDVANTLRGARSSPTSGNTDANTVTVDQAIKLSKALDKEGRSVIRRWAKKQTKDEELCNIGDMGRLSAYVIQKYIEAHPPR